MERNDIWKSSEQSFVSAYDFAKDVINGKLVLSSLEHGRLFSLLKLWINALKNMIEHTSDAEMLKDFQIYQERLIAATQEFEMNFC